MTDEQMIHCKDPARQLERAICIMRRLRAPGGCPWDAQQTHASIVSNLIEEVYECIDAIREEDWSHMREELGDVLLQVLFHADMAKEHADFDINDIACVLADKLVRRHPHVFSNAEVVDSDGVLNQWDAIKRVEQSIEDEPYLHNCGKGLPALMRAMKISKKAAKVGFEWDNAQQVADKVREELAEVEQCFTQPEDTAHLEEELGDLLFSCVNLCRQTDIDPEIALAGANRKFERRFAGIEQILKQQNQSLQSASLDEMEAAWQQVKSQEP